MEVDYNDLFYFHYDLKNRIKSYDEVDREEDIFGVEPYSIEIYNKYFFFEENNKWGLFDLDKGITLSPIFDRFEYDDSNEKTSFYKDNLLGAIVDSLGKVVFEVDEHVLKGSKVFLDIPIFIDQGDSYYEYYSSLYMYLAGALTETVIITDTLEFVNQETYVTYDSIVKLTSLPVYTNGKIVVKDLIGNVNINNPFDDVFYFTPKMYYNSEMYYIENKFMQDNIGRFISVKSTKEYIEKNKYYFVNGRERISSNILLAKRKNNWFLVELELGISSKIPIKLVDELLKTEFNSINYNLEKEIIETELNEVIILYNLNGEIIQN